MPRKKKIQKSKFKFQFLEKGKKVKQRYRWRIVACNGNIVVHSEAFLHRTGPQKTVKNLIKAIQLGNFKVEEEPIEE